MPGKRYGSAAYTDALAHPPNPYGPENRAFMEGATGIARAGQANVSGTPEYAAYTAGASATYNQETGLAGGYNPPTWTATGTNYFRVGSLGTYFASGDDWTVAFWFKPAVVNATQRLFSLGDGSTLVNASLGHVLGSDAGCDFFCEDSGGTDSFLGSVLSTSQEPLIAGTWYHIAYSISGAAGPAKMAQTREGTAQGIGTRAAADSFVATYDGFMSIGAAHNGSTPMTVNGEIRDVWVGKTYIDVASSNPFVTATNGIKSPGASYQYGTGVTPTFFYGGAGYDWTGSTIANLGSAGAAGDMTKI